MASYSTNLKAWGSSGIEFPDGYNYVEGEQPVDAWDNFFNRNAVADIEHLIGLTNARFADEDGSEAAAGGVRLQNQEYLTGRNNADDGDIQMWQVNSGDEIRAGAAVRMGGDVKALHGETIWDESKSYIPETALQDSAVYSDEKAQDAVGTIITGSGATTVNYDDGGNSIEVSSTDSVKTTEEIQDDVGNIFDDTLTYDDGAPSMGVNESNISVDHANLTNVQPNQHHTPPNSLTDLSSRDHSDLQSVSSHQHHPAVPIPPISDVSFKSLTVDDGGDYTVNVPADDNWYKVGDNVNIDVSNQAYLRVHTEGTNTEDTNAAKFRIMDRDTSTVIASGNNSPMDFSGDYDVRTVSSITIGTDGMIESDRSAGDFTRTTLEHALAVTGADIT